jgi:RNA polymerase sigma-70 factor (ECF subfamily)
VILAFPPRANTPDGQEEDGLLVVRARDGALAERHAAYTLLVTRYEGFVRSMLLGLCRQPALADDLAQETFITAWQKLDTLKTPAKFRGWLKQLAYRHFLHAYRRVQIEKKYLPDVAEEPYTEVANVDDLRQLLALCSPIEREIMVLCYGFDFTLKEIAQARGIAVGTVKSHVHRAKQKMRAWLAQEGSGRDDSIGNTYEKQ